MTLVEALGLERCRLVALCGAGGKTSLMFALAREWAAAGERVLVSTTTKMAMTEVRSPWSGYRVADIEGILALAGKVPSPLVAYRSIDAERDKAVGFLPEQIDRLASAEAFSRILIEADGSARRPLKAPAPHEPAIPALADAVVMVAGLSGLGRPLDDTTVFRAELWSELCGEAIGQPVLPVSLARVVTHARGLARSAPARAHRALFLNQADDAGRSSLGRDVLAALHEVGGCVPARAVIGRLLPQVEIVDTSTSSESGRGEALAEGLGG